MLGMLSARGRLDATDVEIIALRSLSQMPTLSEVGKSVNMSKQAVSKRVQKIQNSMKTWL
jgi:DNA-binding Lrp family transcriptional regulator